MNTDSQYSDFIGIKNMTDAENYCNYHVAGQKESTKMRYSETSGYHFRLALFTRPTFPGVTGTVVTVDYS